MMQVRLREEFDADVNAEKTVVSDVKTGTHHFEIKCDVCNRALFVDDATRESIEQKIEKGLEERFVCSNCEMDADVFEHDAS